MRYTVSTIAIAAATFAATLAFAPVVNFGQTVDFSKLLTAPAPAPVVTVSEPRECTSPFGLIIKALGDRNCL